MNNRISKRQVGFNLQKNYNSEVTFGGENTNKFYNQHQYIISGLTNYWQFYGLNRLDCGTFSLNTLNELVRFSSATPYIAVPQCKSSFYYYRCWSWYIKHICIKRISMPDRLQFRLNRLQEKWNIS